MSMTEKGIFQGADMDVLHELFSELSLQKYKRFIDLGSGDGRVVYAASNRLLSVGIEFDKELVDLSISLYGRTNHPVKFICGDFYEHNISKYDVVFIAPDTGFENGMEDKLQQELKGLLIVYNNLFLPRKLKLVNEFEIKGVPITVWRTKN